MQVLCLHMADIVGMVLEFLGGGSTQPDALAAQVPAGAYPVQAPHNFVRDK